MLIAIIKIIKISPIAEVLFSKFVQQQKKLPYYAHLLFCFLFFMSVIYVFLGIKNYLKNIRLLRMQTRYWVTHILGQFDIE